jgi:hypothetical protein
MAVAVSSTGTAVYNTSAATQNYTFTVNASDTLAVFFIAQDATQTITSVTWDSGGTNQACTLVGSEPCFTATHGKIYIYAVVNPTSGTKTLSVVQGTATGLSAELQSYTGTVASSVAAACTNVLVAKAASALDATGTKGTAAQSGVSGDMYVSAYATSSSFTTLSNTTIYALVPAGNDASGNRVASTGTSIALTVNLSASGDWAAVSCDIAAAGAGDTLYEAKKIVMM